MKILFIIFLIVGCFVNGFPGEAKESRAWVHRPFFRYCKARIGGHQQGSKFVLNYKSGQACSAKEKEKRLQHGCAKDVRVYRFSQTFSRTIASFRQYCWRLHTSHISPAMHFVHTASAGDFLFHGIHVLHRAGLHSGRCRHVLSRH